tara:strand:+ start:3945 stop:4145 length:201 start_codon:yes stop_codon:yes gene_type:complete
MNVEPFPSFHFGQKISDMMLRVIFIAFGGLAEKRKKPQASPEQQQNELTDVVGAMHGQVDVEFSCG